MQKTILCAIDFSKASNRALKCAALLAHDLHSHLTLLHTYRLLPNKDEGLFEQKRRLEESAAQQFALLEKEYLLTRGVTYDYKTEVGFVVDRVEALTGKSHIQFLVIDKDMAQRSKEAFDELIQNSKVPLIIVP